jgi:hypothetical protein
MLEFNIETDKNYIFGKAIFESLHGLIDTLDDGNLSGFQKQENFEKIVLGLEIVNKIGIQECQNVKNLLNNPISY